MMVSLISSFFNSHSAVKVMIASLYIIQNFNPANLIKFNNTPHLQLSYQMIDDRGEPFELLTQGCRCVFKV